MFSKNIYLTYPFTLLILRTKMYLFSHPYMLCYRVLFFTTSHAAEVRF